VAAELTAATGRPVEFTAVPDEGAKQAMIEAGLPDFFAEQAVNAFAMRLFAPAAVGAAR
jgi:uncharacterized protein YbjT (DUF2867 family)